MAEYYHATVSYPADYQVEVVHKGSESPRSLVRAFRRIGATITIGDALPPEKAQQYRALEAAIRPPKRLTWHPRIDIPEADDDGDD